MTSRVTVKQVALESLTPYEKNARTHSDEQIAQIVDSVAEWGWTNPVLIDEQGRILAGHGRYEAAQSMGLEKIPAITVKGWSDAQKRAYTIADNQLALNASWDEKLLAMELGDLNEMDYDLGLIGFDEDEISRLIDNFDAPDPEDLNNYSRKIEAPIYEITGEQPEPHSLVNTEKTAELLREIDETEMPKDIADFLRQAAYRHSVFDYARIAEFYAHAEPQIQRLMEQSALIIIDFDQAVEGGFVQLSETLLEDFGVNT